VYFWKKILPAGYNIARAVSACHETSACHEVWGVVAVNVMLMLEMSSVFCSVLAMSARVL